jgi:hypothetical protein
LSGAVCDGDSLELRTEEAEQIQLGAAAGTPAVTAPVSFSDPSLTRLVPRWALLVLLLAAELVALALPFDARKGLRGVAA